MNDIKKLSFSGKDWIDVRPYDWSPDGKTILFAYYGGNDGGANYKRYLGIIDVETQKI